ncbi:ELMO domain-containing protein 2-like [Dysidea avara]|uniref:ELMO domain-containing protein 2-like n=1 Tax=Dysidea avara TaxID=196820 RepID=UPI003334387F
MLIQWLWRVWKWLLRLFTGQCELERLCYMRLPLHQLALRVENSLRRSRALELRRLLDGDHTSDNAIDVVLRVKRIKNDAKCMSSLRSSLQIVVGVAGLVREVELLKKDRYNKDNEHHESLLSQLWDHMMPSEKLTSRVSEQWKDLGFQGTDPATDFRGMGLFGLTCLHHLASCRGDLARQLLSHSRHPTLGYPYAIVGIDLASMIWEMLERRVLYAYLYKTAPPISLQCVMELFCEAMREFDSLWQTEKPENILAYPRVREKFLIMIREKWTT